MKIVDGQAYTIRIPEANTCNGTFLFKRSRSRCFQHEESSQNYSSRSSGRALAVYGRYRQEHKVNVVAIGGMPDHIHMLMALPGIIGHSTAIQKA